LGLHKKRAEFDSRRLEDGEVRMCIWSFAAGVVASIPSASEDERDAPSLKVLGRRR
jgi:hypothetical protein